MKVAVGSDHAGFELKQKITEYLAASGMEVHDLGTVSTDSVDYPDFAEKVALEVRDGRADRGILMCGTGIGVCIAANKVRGIRGAVVWDAEVARLSREHNDSNVLCLPGRFMAPETARPIVDAWLRTEFAGGRHTRRIEKIARIEADNRGQEKTP